MPASMRDPGGRRTFALFWILGAVLLAGYAHATPFNARTHDLGAQLRYIQLVADHHRIPGGTDCWECHQPPAYYALAAAVLAAGGWPVPGEHAPPGDAGARALQILAVVLSIGSLGCWLRIVQLAIDDAYERTVASALAAFWPALAIDGCTVNTDAPACLLASAALAQLLAWRRSGRAGALVAAGALAGAGLNVKASAIPIAALVVAAIAAAVARPRPGSSRWPRGAAPALAVLLAFAGLWAFVVVHFKGGVTHPSWSSLQRLRVENRLADFVMFRAGSFLADPWVHLDAGPARDEFWSYLLRSSLFGESASKDAALRALATALAAAALFFVPFVLAGFFLCARRGGRGRLLAAAAAFLFAFLAALRLQYPYAVHNDFRFVLPAVAPCAILFAAGAGAFRRRTQRRWPHLAALPGWVVAAFCAISARLLLFGS